VIEAKALSKRYGSVQAVDDLSFTIVPGQVTGFLGPNGSGKSTTMRMIVGLDAPTSGTVTIAGRPGEILLYLFGRRGAASGATTPARLGRGLRE